jgi:hypothetical protein
MMAETLEIETITTFRGPLAERLLKLASERKREPVEIVADIVELGINGETSADASRIKVLCNELDDLRKRYQRLMDGALPKSKPTFPPKTRATLEAAAAARKLKVDDLIYEIIVMVAADDLFAAVLDAE